MNLGLLKRLLLRKISTALRASVTLGRIELAPVKGIVDAHDVAASLDGQEPFFRAPRVRAKLVMPALAHRELVLRSVLIEQPVVRLSRRADGSLAVPRAPQQPHEASDDDSGWRVVLEQLVVTGGSARVELSPGQVIAAASVDAGVSACGGHHQWTLIARGIGQPGAAPLVQDLRCLGRLETSGHFQPMALTCEADADQSLQARLTYRPQTGEFRLETEGELDVNRLVPIMPVPLRAATRLLPRAGGKFTLQASLASVGSTCSGNAKTQPQGRKGAQRSEKNRSESVFPSPTFALLCGFAV